MSPTLQSLGIDRMPIKDRIRLVDEIWESIAAETVGEEIPQWHKDILDERLAYLEANPQNSVPWEEAMGRILSRRSRKPE
jgi:putative addiction module component (TIGR02574 family)